MIKSITIENPMNPENTYTISGLTRFNFLVGKLKSITFQELRMQVVNIKENKPKLWSDIKDLESKCDRMASILLDIAVREEGYLFIENIETGLHYTYYPTVLEHLLIFAMNKNWQMFITTDSKEMLQSIKHLPQDFGQQFSVHRTNLLMSKSTDYTYSEIVFCAEEENDYDKEMRGL